MSEEEEERERERGNNGCRLQCSASQTHLVGGISAGREQSKWSSLFASGHVVYPRAYMSSWQKSEVWRGRGVEKGNILCKKVKYGGGGEWKKGTFCE